MVKTLIKEIAAENLKAVSEKKDISIKDAWVIVQEFVVLVEQNKEKFGEAKGEVLGDSLAEVLNEAIDVDNMPAWLEDNYFRMAVSAAVSGFNKSFGKQWVAKLALKDKADSFMKKAEEYKDKAMEFGSKAKDLLVEKGGQLKDKAVELKDSGSKFIDDKISGMLKDKVDKLVDEKLEQKAKNVDGNPPA